MEKPKQSSNFRMIGYLILTGIISIGGGTVGTKMNIPPKADIGLETRITELNEEILSLKKQIVSLKLLVMERDSQIAIIQSDIEDLKIETYRLKKGAKRE